MVEYYFFNICNSRPRIVLLGVIYGYKALLQIVALVLAVTTRKVKVKGLNDSIYVAASIYITSLLWAVVIVSIYSLREFLNINTIVFCVALFVGTTTLMSLLFFPKVYR